jgi:hypothetical protein
MGLTTRLCNELEKLSVNRKVGYLTISLFAGLLTIGSYFSNKILDEHMQNFPDPISQSLIYNNKTNPAGKIVEVGGNLFIIHSKTAETEPSLSAQGLDSYLNLIPLRKKDRREKEYLVVPNF